MGFSNPENSKRLFQRRSPWCVNYERFNNNDGKDEMQKKDVFKIQPRKGSKETFLERFNNGDGEGEKKKGAFNI